MPDDTPKYVVWEQVKLAQGAYRIQKVKTVDALPDLTMWSAVSGGQFEDELTMALGLLGWSYKGCWQGVEFTKRGASEKVAWRDGCGGAGRG